MDEAPTLPPFLRSEVSSRLAEVTGAGAALLELGRRDELKMPGGELMKVLEATWLLGYGGCIEDILDGGGPIPKPTPMMQWIIENMIGGED